MFELNQQIERVLLDETSIRWRLDLLAKQVTEVYRDKELTVIVVLNGSLVFAADLLRRVPLPLRLDCISVASYHGGTQSSGVVTFLQNVLPDVEGRHVLILDDILDTGNTLHAIREKLLAEGNPLSVKLGVLLRKHKAREKAIDVDFVGFEIGDEFIVGYGLDFQGRYRNLPYIGVLKQQGCA
jgi:hypoxanthine phosphoribosyltransferase